MRTMRTTRYRTTTVRDPDDDEITEDNYSTMMDLGSEDPDDEAANLIEFVDE